MPLSNLSNVIEQCSVSQLKIRVLRAQTQEGQVDRVENQEKSVLFRLVGDSVTALSNLGAQWMHGGKKVAGIDMD